MKRRVQFALGEIYHVCNKSISSYNIFRKDEYSQRFMNIFAYYNSARSHSYSMYLRKNTLFTYGDLIRLAKPNFRALAYCIMPDHYHLLFSTQNSSEVSKFIGTLENSFTRFYNVRNCRKGPLWQSEFRCRRIANDEQLLHVTRYIHLNPVTAGLVSDPRYWSFSSYKFYLNQEVLDSLKQISIRSTNKYESFVLDNKDYQKKLKQIRNQLRDY